MKLPCGKWDHVASYRREPRCTHNKQYCAASAFYDEVFNCQSPFVTSADDYQRFVVLPSSSQYLL